MMIPVKDIRYSTPQFVPQPVQAPAFTNLQLVTLILAAIHITYNICTFLLNVPTIFFMIASGQWLLALLFLFIGSLKHICQALWFIELFKPELNPFHTNPIITKSIIGGGLAAMGILMVVDAVMIYAETHSMFEVMTQPTVIEAITFVLADTFALILELEKKSFNAKIHYAPMKTPAMGQFREIEMAPQPVYGFTYVPYQ